jgi:hypothetical protein
MRVVSDYEYEEYLYPSMILKKLPCFLLFFFEKG